MAKHNNLLRVESEISTAVSRFVTNLLLDRQRRVVEQELRSRRVHAKMGRIIMTSDDESEHSGSDFVAPDAQHTRSHCTVG